MFPQNNCGWNTHPWGGTSARLGTNPLAAGLPRGEGKAIVLDMTTSVVAEGKIRIRRNRGEAVPEGWITDAKGDPATDPEAFEGGVGNIPDSEIYGAELELSAFLSDDVILDLRMSWLDTEITADHLALDNVESESATNALLAQGIGLFSNDVQIARAGRIQNVRGNELAKTPSFTGNVGLNWTDSLNWGELKGTIQYTYRGGFKHRIFNNNTTDVVPNYDVLDVMLGFYPAGAQNNLRFELIGKNLFDKDGINARFTDVFGVGATGDELIAPRQIMLRIGAEF